MRLNLIFPSKVEPSRRGQTSRADEVAIFER